MDDGIKETDRAKILEVFGSHPEVEKVILYGSRAKGTYKPASDIDLTLTGHALNLTIQQQIETELDDLLLPFTFDLSIFHQISNTELINHIERVGKVMYPKSA